MPHKKASERRSHNSSSCELVGVEQIPSSAPESGSDRRATDGEHPHEIESFPSEVRSQYSLCGNPLGWSQVVIQVQDDVPSTRRAAIDDPQRGQAKDTADGSEARKREASAAVHIDIECVSSRRISVYHAEPAGLQAIRARSQTPR